MQLSRADIEILTEAASRLLAAETHAKWVIAETFLKATKRGVMEAGSDNEHVIDRGNSSATMAALEVMLHLIDAQNVSKLYNMAHEIAGAEYGADIASEHQLAWYADQRAGAQDRLANVAASIAARYVNTYKPES